MGPSTKRRNPPLPADEGPVLSASLLGVLGGTTLLVVGLMSLYLVMRNLGLDYGGACASGGPYEIRPGQECESGVFASAYVSIAVLVVGALLLLWSSRRYGGPLVVTVAMWVVASVFFGGLGAGFLKVAADMPARADGISDFRAVGVTFLVLAALGLGSVMVTIRYGDRIGRFYGPRPTSRVWLAWSAAIATGAVIGLVAGTLVMR